VFEQARDTGEDTNPATETIEKVTRDLDKFWSFQTKATSEMIESIGETEKNSRDSLERFQEEISKKLEDTLGERLSGDLDQLREELAKLHEAAQSREEGMEELSSTVSQMVMNFEDRLAELHRTSTSLADRVEKFEKSIPRGDDVRKWIEDSVAPRDESDVSDDVRSLKEQIESFIDSNTHIDEGIREWQQKMDSRVDEIRDGQSAWAETIEELSARSAEKEEVVEDQGPSAEDKKKSRKLNNLGVTSFHNGELELARDQFEEAVSLDEGFAECFNNLGLVYTELDEEEKATEAFSTAIELNPELHAAYNNLGYVFYKQGSYDQAIEMYNEALGRNATNSSSYTNLGNAYFKQDKREEAQKAWEKALKLDPSNRKASRSLKELERTPA
jgi:tetratricopeptide (TPR) repeat protein